MAEVTVRFGLRRWECVAPLCSYRTPFGVTDALIAHIVNHVRKSHRLMGAHVPYSEKLGKWLPGFDSFEIYMPQSRHG